MPNTALIIFIIWMVVISLFLGVQMEQLQEIIEILEKGDT